MKIRLKMEKEQMHRDKIFTWSEGNPGAISFLMEMDRVDTGVIVSTLEKLKSIRGTNLYVLWSDLCEKNMHKVEALCRHCLADILEDACGRQDYSGRELVSKYLPEAVV